MILLLDMTVTKSSEIAAIDTVGIHVYSSETPFTVPFDDTSHGKRFATYHYAWWDSTL